MGLPQLSTAAAKSVRHPAVLVIHSAQLHKKKPTYTLICSSLISNKIAVDPFCAMDQQLHIFFFPLMAHGHTTPMLEMAKLFASRAGVKTTIISTPTFAQPIITAQESGFDVGLKVLQFPSPESGLPAHVVSIELADSDELVSNFGKAVALLQNPFDELVQELNPDCLVSDMFLPWTVDSAARFGIPRLVFHGTCCFSLCVAEQMRRHKPFKHVSSESEPFLLPGLPHQLELVRTQIFEGEFEETDDDFSKVLKLARESDWRSYGVVINSFHELEPDYIDHYKRVLGRKSWNIGPLLLCSSKGEESATDRASLAWLDSRKPESVVYACFGSTESFSPVQLREIGIGLEASGQDFIWVLRKSDQEWMPDIGFEEMVKGKGLIIRGWAPQVAILDHEAVGAFVTHCGWNSIIEGVRAGVPMVTWPVYAEQFFNEKLVTQVLRIGVSVGNKRWQRIGSEGVMGEAVARTVQRVMSGDFEALAMRNRAKEYKEMARKAAEKGGSSHNDLSALIDELSTLASARKHPIKTYMKTQLDD